MHPRLGQFVFTLLVIPAFAGCMGGHAWEVVDRGIPWDGEARTVAAVGQLQGQHRRQPAGDAAEPRSHRNTPCPVEVVCIWQPATGKGLNGLPTRGLAGQIMLFEPGNPKPVAADGDLRLYLFDSEGTLEEQARPIHIFDVPAVQWSAHRQASPLGPSYQIFVPYVKGGHRQVTCTVHTRFTPVAGRPIHSQLASITLPGKIEPREEEVALLPAPRRRLPPTARAAEPAPSGTATGVRTINPWQVAAELAAQRRTEAEVQRVSHEQPVGQAERGAAGPGGPANLSPGRKFSACTPEYATPRFNQYLPLLGDPPASNAQSVPSDPLARSAGREVAGQRPRRRYRLTTERSFPNNSWSTGESNPSPPHRPADQRHPLLR